MSVTTLEPKPRSAPAPTGVVARPVVANQMGRRNAPPPRPVGQDADAARTLVKVIIRRIEGYLDEETTALDKLLSFDLKASNDRKSQGLVDLNQAMRRLKATDIDADLQLRLNAFRQKLAINLRKIRLHLDAVKEITAMLSDAIQSADSDGTYTRQIGPSRSYSSWSD